jgi:GABA permease
MIHQCPRCDLRFRSNNELKEHLGHDHATAAERLDSYWYPAHRTLEPLYAEDVESPPPRRARRYLVVANQTLIGPALLGKLRELASAGPAQFQLLVPATHSADHVAADGEPDGSRQETDEAGAAQARWRLRTTVDRLRQEGMEVRGELGGPDPFTAIQNALRRERFDEVVLSTLPSALSRWLEADLPRRIERELKLPVTTVIAPAAGTG